MVNLTIYGVLDLMRYSRGCSPHFPEEKTEDPGGQTPSCPTSRAGLCRTWGDLWIPNPVLFPPGNSLIHSGKVKPQKTTAEKLPGDKAVPCRGTEVPVDLTRLPPPPNSRHHNASS